MKAGNCQNGGSQSQSHISESVLSSARGAVAGDHSFSSCEEVGSDSSRNELTFGTISNLMLTLQVFCFMLFTAIFQRVALIYFLGGGEFGVTRLVGS